PFSLSMSTALFVIISLHDALPICRLRDVGVKAIAVCLLFSYLYPDHERAIARIIAEEIPDAYVSISSEVLPEFREFERLSTVVTDRKRTRLNSSHKIISYAVFRFI